MLSQATIIKYLENKGYENTAKFYRRSSGFGNATANPMVTVTKMHNYYFNLDEEEDECTFKQSAVEESTSSSAPEPVKRSFGEMNKVVDSSEGERCFLGNMSFKINEEALHKAFADCGKIMSIEWITDKNTGQFYGSGFAVFESTAAARKAVAASGRNILSRPIKVNFAPLKQAEASDKRKMPPAPLLAAKPAECRTLFLGNLAFDVTEDIIKDFFRDCGEVYQIRFQLRSDGDFKGCGFIEFYDTYAVDEAIKLHAEHLHGRPVRIDYA